uniref:Uncharacterized protein n=1 Tax=Amphimedon queenslandica TaxID=400682 RepID=A0A1X7TKW9_AMPQE
MGILKAWGANMDIQYVLKEYACMMYVALYIMKAEKSMSKLLCSVSEEILKAVRHSSPSVFKSSPETPAEPIMIDHSSVTSEFPSASTTKQSLSTEVEKTRTHSVKVKTCKAKGTLQTTDE